ncbi:biotinidase [Astyanax mexicanus]|uniref:biotinidase n=1 Tax=Astyanax mexicanus TaxID=7994 RepID=UPI0020CB1445|nr:biotinidase [Astyanax mexicanus]
MASPALLAAALAVCVSGIPRGCSEGVWRLPPVLDRSYVAAVYEHQVILNPNPKIPVWREAALEHMKKNLDVFEEQTALAAQQGAQIIVFPEDGIHGFNYSRASIASYLEPIPDPTHVTWSPCADPDRFPNTEVLHRLSCMARKNCIFLVANMPDRQLCSRLEDPLCPVDGQYQYNTDVVFSSDGTLVARYHKQNLYFEAAFDKPPQCEYVTFTTPFAGRFGVFTCFDILFREPAVTLVKDMGVRQLVYPTAWMNQLPLLAAVQFQRSFSFSTGVTLLAANIRSAALGMTGSGIFTPQDALYHHDMDGESGKLLVKRVPVLDPSVPWTLSEAGNVKGNGTENGTGTEAGNVDGKGAGKACMRTKPLSYPIKEEEEVQNKPGHCFLCRECSPSDEQTPFNSTMMYDKFTMLPLQGSEGNLTVCDGSLCCQLLFRRQKPPEEELYALGAFNGLHVVHGTYYLEVCALVRCTSLDKASCGGETEHAQTMIDFHLEGSFSTEHVYAGVLGSGMSLDLPDITGRRKNGRFHMNNTEMTTGLVTAVLYGRVYEKDGTDQDQFAGSSVLF